MVISEISGPKEELLSFRGDGHPLHKFPEIFFPSPLQECTHLSPREEMGEAEENIASIRKAKVPRVTDDETQEITSRTRQIRPNETSWAGRRRNPRRRRLYECIRIAESKGKNEISMQDAALPLPLRRISKLYREVGEAKFHFGSTLSCTSYYHTASGSYKWEKKFPRFSALGPFRRPCVPFRNGS